MEEEDDDDCPLCMETFDETDLNFFPCPCEYQICLWCFDKMKLASGRCPACRSPYDEDNYRYREEDRNELVKREKAKKKKGKDKTATKASAPVPAPAPVAPVRRVDVAPPTPAALALERAYLTSTRVIQRNLVYIIGIAPSIADEDRLRQFKYFGQYGKIVKIVVNRANLEANGPSASASAYITYDKKEDSMECIMSMDGFWVEGRMLRASFGTTKYCNFFLRGFDCNNSECLYLHDVGDGEDSFSKEQMIHQKQYFNEQTHPGPGPGPQYEVEGPTVLPPPSYRKKKEAALKSSGGAVKGEGEQDAKEEATPAPAPAANVWKMGSAIAVVKASPAAVKSGGVVAGGSKVVQTSLAPSTSSAVLTPTEAAPVMSPSVSGTSRKEEASSQSVPISSSSGAGASISSNGAGTESGTLEAHASLPSTGASSSSLSTKEVEVSSSEARSNEILKVETVTPSTGGDLSRFSTEGVLETDIKDRSRLESNQVLYSLLSLANMLKCEYPAVGYLHDRSATKSRFSFAVNQ